VESTSRNIRTVVRKVWLSTASILMQATNAQRHCVEIYTEFIQIGKKQDRQFAYDVTLRRFRVTIVVAEEQ
jgi:hypothetical protein